MWLLLVSLWQCRPGIGGCSGQQETTEGASLVSDVVAAKPIPMLRAAKSSGAVFWVQPAVAAQFLGGSFLRKL